ncbi:MAG TPA: 4-hydroxy-tetrahydrodipicolinate synthase [Armatimonadota bacterium]|nr:4-hydroxy-tetrahydrodipicolinate synthase [Armatimonadota bacterium]
MNFQGAWTALITPMTTDGGVDWAGLEKNLQFQAEQGITGVVPTGTTGESPTLVWDEHNKIIERTLKTLAGKCEVIAGTGSNSTQEAVESTERAAEHGAKAALLVDCYYNGPSSLELRNEYYGVLAEFFPDISFIPYVIPGRSGTALAVEDLAILAGEYPNIHAVKEATGDLERMAKTRSLLGPDFFILSGDDDITYKMMTTPEIKAAGVISVISNVAPAAVKQMVAKVLAGDLATASALRDALAPLFGIVTVKVESTRTLPNGKTAIVQDRFRNPLAIKTLMSALGMPAGPGRQPLGRMTADGVEVVRNAARTVWERNPEILAPIGDFFGVNVEGRIAEDSVWAELSYL